MGDSYTHKFVPDSWQAQVMEKFGSTDDIYIEEEENVANFHIAQMNNAFQMAMHESDRLFNQQQAALGRSFARDEAQKARDWNSEQSVMQRRSEAGLNTAMVGNGAGASNSASSPAAGAPSAVAPAAPSLQSPQMIAKSTDQKIIGSLSAGADALEKLSNLPKNVEGRSVAQATAKNLLASADRESASAEYQKILNSYTPEQLNATIAEMVSRTDYQKSNAKYYDALAIRNTQDTRAVLADMYYKFVQSKVAERGSNLDVEQLKNDWAQIGLQLEHDSTKLKNQLRSTAVSLAYNTWQNSKSSDLTEYASMGHTLNTGNNFNAGIGGKGSKNTGEEDSFTTMSKSFGKQFTELNKNTLGKSILGAIDLNGGISNGKSFFDSEFAQSVTGTAGYKNLFNTDAYNKAVENIALSKIIQDPKSTFKQRSEALGKILELRISWQDFENEIINNADRLINPDAQPNFQQTP